jgi:hypothetical protein
MTPDIFEKLAEVSAAQREMAVLQRVHTETLDKQIKLLEDQRDILMTNTIIVKDHERRSTQLEGRMGILEDKMAPVERHLSELSGMNKAMKTLGAVFAILASAAAVVEVIKMFVK